mgnify:CR=1 FL=1
MRSRDVQCDVQHSIVSIGVCVCFFFFCFQAEDGIRDLVRSRGLGDVYKRQQLAFATFSPGADHC